MAQHPVSCSLRIAVRWREGWWADVTIVMHHASHILLQAILQCLDGNTPPISTDASILTKQHMIDDWPAADASKTHPVL